MKKLFVFIAVAVFIAAAAMASFIRLQTSVTTNLNQGVLKTSVSVVNKGDEPAHNVQAELRVAGQKILLDKVSQLGVNAKYSAAKKVKLNLDQPGQYPLVVVMHYTDGNQYPFSAVTCHTFNHQTGALPTDVFGKMSSSTFWQTGEVKLTLKNLSEQELQVSAKLHTPRELTVIDNDKKIFIAPKSSAKVKFKLENFSALSGSSYQLFAVAEYAKDGFHQTSVIPATVRLEEVRLFLGINYSYLVGLLGALVILFLLIQFGLPLIKK